MKTNKNQAPKETRSKISYRIKKFRRKRKNEENIKLRKQISKQIKTLHNKRIPLPSKKIDTLPKGYLFFRYANNCTFLPELNKKL